MKYPKKAKVSTSGVKAAKINFQDIDDITLRQLFYIRRNFSKRNNYHYNEKNVRRESNKRADMNGEF